MDESHEPRSFRSASERRSQVNRYRCDPFAIASGFLNSMWLTSIGEKPLAHASGSPTMAGSRHFQRALAALGPNLSSFIKLG